MSFSNAIERALETIRERGLAMCDTPVLLMVSGGSDSTALAYIASELRKRNEIGPLGIMHLNHNLRGECSDADADFVSALSDSLNLPLYPYSVDVGIAAREEGGNLEAVARRERYAAAVDALEKLCMSAGVPLSEGRIFTAHTRNDRVENFFMRSIVGTGPGGFRSMLYRNGSICRPLLDLEREELREFVKLREMDAQAAGDVPIVFDGKGALWREDATNAHTDQFRGYVRHEIVPQAMARNPKLLEVLCRTMNLIADEDDMLATQAESLVKREVRWLSSHPEESFRGCMVLPDFASEPIPLQRRAMVIVLQRMLGQQARVEARSIERALAAFQGGVMNSGYTSNIQGNLALSANKRGLRIEPMVDYRTRRKKR